MRASCWWTRSRPAASRSCRASTSRRAMRACSRARWRATRISTRRSSAARPAIPSIRKRSETEQAGPSRNWRSRPPCRPASCSWRAPFNGTTAIAANLQIHTLDELWCRPGDPAAGAWGAFPDWIYESADLEYLSRIFFPEAVTAAARRLAIRAGLMQPPARADGFMPTNLTPVPKTKLTATGSPIRQSRAGQPFPRAGAARGAHCRIAGGCSAGVRVHPALRQHAAGPRQPGRGAAAGLQGRRPADRRPAPRTPPGST